MNRILEHMPLYKFRKTDVVPPPPSKTLAQIEDRKSYVQKLAMS